jgi:hypothetical protein
VSVDFEPAVAAEASCPHMAILLESHDEVPPTLASFYSLGLRRNGWLFHRALPGSAEVDRTSLKEAGLDTAPLEAEGRFELCEVPITEPPETWAEPWIPLIDKRLADGYSAIWWSRFPVGIQDDDIFERALEYDHHWDIAVAGRTAISLCVYVVGGLPSAQREHRVAELSAIHDHTLELRPGGELVGHLRADRP